MQKEAFFPAELWQDLPHITLTGGQLLHIEQHHGMVSYQPNQIVFDTSRGMLTVMGESLHVRKYTSTEAQLVGQIDAVLLKEQEG